MQIIKEYCEESKRCVIRTNCYGRTVEYFKKLITEAKKDDPNLSDEDIDIVQFAGQRYARTYGIEFKSDKIQKGYFKINQLECTF